MYSEIAVSVVTFPFGLLAGIVLARYKLRKKAQQEFTRQHVEWLNTCAIEHYREQREDLKNACHDAWQLWAETSITDLSMDSELGIPDSALDDKYRRQVRMATKLLATAGVYAPALCQPVKTFIGNLGGYRATKERHRHHMREGRNDQLRGEAGVESLQYIQAANKDAQAIVEGFKDVLKKLEPELKHGTVEPAPTGTKPR